MGPLSLKPFNICEHGRTAISLCTHTRSNEAKCTTTHGSRADLGERWGGDLVQARCDYRKTLLRGIIGGVADAEDATLEHVACSAESRGTGNLGVGQRGAISHSRVSRALLTVLQDPNDLPFEVGDVIEVITETNADWWTGRDRSGKQGLFPSNYVEKLPPRGVSPILVPEPRKSVYSGPVGRYASPALPHPSPQGPSQPYPAVPQAYYPAPSGPPPGAVNYSYAPPPGPPTPQPAPQQAPAKKSKFGGLGQVVSAAGS